MRIQMGHIPEPELLATQEAATYEAALSILEYLAISNWARQELF